MSKCLSNWPFISLS